MQHASEPFGRTRSNSSRVQTEIEGMDAIKQYETQHKEEQAHMTEAEQSMRDEEISFYSNSENEFGDDNIWGLLSGVGGNIYEW
jgi:ribulose 1,5-bisphosphate carboxylase large subunit-like protein